MLVVVGKYFDLQQYFDLHALRRSIAAAGAWGYLLYVVLFILGELIHIFGLIFVAAGVYVWGQKTGFLLAMIGGTASVCVSFLLVRAIGGKAFAGIQKPWVQRVLLKLNQKPIRSVIVLRTFLLLHPSLNYLLALTNIRFRDYAIGSVMGLVTPIALFVLFFDWLMKKLPSF